jgi:hypothetical protein
MQVPSSSRLPQLQSYYATRWTLPSPNMPSWLSCLFFVSFVMLEGTNVSEVQLHSLPPSCCYCDCIATATASRLLPLGLQHV